MARADVCHLQRGGRGSQVGLELVPSCFVAINDVRDRLERNKRHTQLFAHPRDRSAFHLLDYRPLRHHQLHVGRRAVERIRGRDDTLEARSAASCATRPPATTPL